jgi:signal transduction histidine kinase
LVLMLDGAGYYLAVHSVMRVAGHQTALIAALEDIFVAVAVLTITVGLVLPGMIAHSMVEVAKAADRLATGTLADFSRAMRALAGGDLDGASARVDFVPVLATSRDEVGAMARSFNTLQEEIARAAVGLAGAREGLRAARRELTEINANLERRVMDRTAELEAAHRKLIVGARQAGMAEVAIGVLHNVGNVLNSVNVSASLIEKRLRNSRVKNLSRVTDLIATHREDLGGFLTQDEKGKLVPQYLVALATHIEAEQSAVFLECDLLTQNIEHIKQIVDSQQSLARGASIVEAVDPVALMEDALRINAASLDHHGVRVERHYGTVSSIVADKHQLIQILVNLIRNAVRSIKEGELANGTIVVTVANESANGDRILWQVHDNGVGIPAEHLTRIFEYGFTTKSDGSGGFGLHTAALAANLMAGSLNAHSGGGGQGATFSLMLPAHSTDDAQLAGDRVA